MFSGAFSSVSTSGSVRPQGGWLSSLSTSISTDASSNTQRKMPLRGMTLPVLPNPKENHQNAPNETDSTGGVAGPQPIVAVAPRLGVLGWFGSSSSINTGVERPQATSDEPKAQVEEIAVVRSEPVCPIADKEGALLEREQKVESREKELEERKLVIDQRERELDDRCREWTDLEKKGEEATRRKMEGVERREKELDDRCRELADMEKRGEEATRRKMEEVEKKERELDDRCRELADVEKRGEEVTRKQMEEVERREKELEERRGEFEEERKRWIEERNIGHENPAVVPTPEVVESHIASEWMSAMETLKKEMGLELSTERKKAEERELALETRVMKKVTEILTQDRDSQLSSGWKKKWDIYSIGKPLTRKSTSSTASDFGI